MKMNENILSFQKMDKNEDLFIGIGPHFQTVQEEERKGQRQRFCCMPFRAPALSREKRITPDRMAPPAVDTRKGTM